MLKFSLILGLTTAIASAWFMPTMSFGGSDDERYENVDKSFLRDAKKEVVIDTKKSKMYYDSTPSNKMHFYAAWDYCQNMDYLNHNDWHVASKKELVSLLELSRRSVTVKHAFKNIQEERYWSSTDDRYDKAWYFDFDLGRYSTQYYEYTYRAICVRDIK